MNIPLKIIIGTEKSNYNLYQIVNFLGCIFIYYLLVSTFKEDPLLYKTEFFILSQSYTSSHSLCYKGFLVFFSYFILIELNYPHKAFIKLISFIYIP